MLDEALRETFPASDPVAITIDQPLRKVFPTSKVVAAPAVTRAPILRGPALAEAGPEAEAKEQTQTGPLDAMLWGPIQFFSWWSLLVWGRTDP
jgi:hypothetical protein